MPLTRSQPIPSSGCNGGIGGGGGGGELQMDSRLLLFIFDIDEFCINPIRLY